MMFAVLSVLHMLVHCMLPFTFAFRSDLQNCWNWCTLNRFIAKIKVASFLRHTVYYNISTVVNCIVITVVLVMASLVQHSSHSCKEIHCTMLLCLDVWCSWFHWHFAVRFRHHP